MKSSVLPIVLLGVIAAFQASSLEGADDPPTLEQVFEISDRSGLGNDRLRQMLAFVDGLDAGGVERALDQLVARDPAGQHYELIRMLYARWVELDRKSALAHALNQKGNQQFGALGSVISLWAAEDADAAWAWFEKEGADVEQGNLAHTILSQIAKEDPQKALTLFRESKALRKTGYSNNPATIYGIWALRDPAAAAEHWKSETNFEARRSAAMSIISVWVDQDPAASWEWIKNMKQNRDRLAFAKSFFSRLGLKDLEVAKEFLMEIPAGQEHESAVEAIISGLVIKDPEGAFEFARAQGAVRENSNWIAMIFNYWASKDSERAFEVAKKELKPGSTRKSAMANIIQSVSQKDVDRAEAMLNEIGLEASTSFAVGSVAAAKARVNIEEAVAWSDQLPEGEIRRDAQVRVMSEWVEEDPEAAAAFAQNAAVNDPHNTLLRNVLNEWSRQNPASAVQWAQHTLEAETLLSLIPSVVNQWAQKDPVKASDWVAALSDEEAVLQNACVAQLAYAWGSVDIVGGLAWLESLKPGTGRDQAITNFSNRLFDDDPELALSWLGKIDDQKQRDRAVEFAVQRYLSSMPEKARRWIQSSSLDAETKKQLLGEK